MKISFNRAAVVFLVGVSALVVSPVQAQGNMMKQLEARFTAADTDQNGKLTKSEAKAGMPRIAQFFEKIDADNTGSITLAQIGAFLAQQKK